MVSINFSRTPFEASVAIQWKALTLHSNPKHVKVVLVGHFRVSAKVVKLVIGSK